MKTPVSYVLAAACLLTGCVSVLPEAAPPAPRFSIGEGIEEASPGAPITWSLSVDEAAATRAVDTTKIAIVRSEGRYEYYSGGEWTDRAPLLFQTSLVRSLQNSGRILGVGSRASQPIADLVLQTDMRRFSINETGAFPVAEVEVFARITDLRGRVKAAQRFSQSAELNRNDASGAAAALNRATKEIVSEIVDWTLAEGDNIPQAK